MANKSLDPEDFEGYGEEMEDMVNLVNAQAQEIDRLKGETSKVAQMQLESLEERYYQALDQAVQDWRRINKNPAFIQWLTGIDEFSGRTRQQLLDEAHATFDANRVIRFFMTYKGGGRASMSTARLGGVTREQFNKAVQDRVQGRITDAEFKKISDSFQRSIKGGHVPGYRLDQI